MEPSIAYFLFYDTIYNILISKCYDWYYTVFYTSFAYVTIWCVYSLLIILER